MEHLKKPEQPPHHEYQEQLGRRLINRRRWRDRIFGLVGGLFFMWFLHANLSFLEYKVGVGCGYWPFWTGASAFFLLIYILFIRNLVRAINEYHRYANQHWHGMGKTIEAYSVIIESLIISLIIFITMSGFLLFGVRCILGYREPLLLDTFIVSSTPTPLPYYK
ncbi:hypothetical protein A2801_00795 [Candidatus Woesebacteria bacterium RIFCSPHIGHO2_01_FULL_41_10]|uniref:Uncharacterized protein n=1 Tax=Candidatus Woesebacteria bacterium RIFCSPHIGHO2_01_FULL_41_10 TaxID=1802500 RepID=A0A1F7YPA2_9BACT|nr:MAG: hypothetical protein A2801_00795 [Candidatus Woesebacteria bacterium RIFCSPHIGHO2_01_FULL_41_10]